MCGFCSVFLVSLFMIDRLGVKATNSKAKARGVKAKALTSKAKAKDLA